MCRLRTFIPSQNKSGIMDVICRNFVTTGFPSLGYFPSSNSALESLFTVHFKNGTCEVLTGKTFENYCCDNYFTVSFQNVTDMLLHCFDLSKPNYEQQRKEQNKPTMQYHNLSTSERGKEMDLLICDVQCEWSDVHSNILHTIKDNLVRKYEHKRQIDIQIDRYEYFGTYTCQIVFADNQTINGTGYHIGIQGIYIQIYHQLFY